MVAAIAGEIYSANERKKKDQLLSDLQKENALLSSKIRDAEKK